MNHPVYDCHVHVTETGDWYGRGGIASFGSYVDCMNEVGIDGALLIPVSESDLDYCLKIRGKESKQFKVAQTLDNPNGANVRWSDVDAIKLVPRQIGQSPLSTEMVDLLVEAGQKAKPVVVCCYTQSEMVPLDELHPYTFDRLAKLCPDTTIVLAHSCWPHLQEALCVARSNSNVYLDISYFAERAQQTSLLIDFCHMAATADRKILYGSDFPEVDATAYLRIFQSLLNLSDEKIQRIFYGNAREVFGFE